jgi:two-component sensor histidine kinase
MVNDMLDISRIERNILRMSRRNCRVEDIVRPVRRALERKASKSDVVLEVTIDENLPTVYCDAEKVGRVIVNLAVNAIKFSSDGERVQLWARHEPNESQVRIGVTDTGPGIPRDQLDSIFRRFTQLRSKPRTSTNGFGLGLSIARELVDLNLGSMTVKSEHGRGSVFSFSVPTAEPSTLLRHYLRRVEDLREPPEFVSLLHVLVDGDAHPGQWADVERFLETQMRRSDLLVKTPRQDWLLVAAADRDGASKLNRRLEDARKEVNRTRSDEELPAIRFHLLGTWRVSDTSDEVSKSFEAAYRWQPDGAARPIAEAAADRASSSRQVENS